MHRLNRAQRLQAFIAKFFFLRRREIAAQIKNNRVNEHDPASPRMERVAGEQKLFYPPA